MTIQIPPDFKEFLNLLNSHGADYLLIGGYAVGYYGYVRPTLDMDLWIGTERENLKRVALLLSDFGFGEPESNLEALEKERGMVRMGVPPFRLEILTSIDGVEFPHCYADRLTVSYDDVEVTLISLRDLKANKEASGRLKDLADLANL